VTTRPRLYVGIPSERCAAVHWQGRPRAAEIPKSATESMGPDGSAIWRSVAPFRRQRGGARLANMELATAEGRQAASNTELAAAERRRLTRGRQYGGVLHRSPVPGRLPASRTAQIPPIWWSAAPFAAREGAWARQYGAGHRRSPPGRVEYRVRRRRTPPADQRSPAPTNMEECCTVHRCLAGCQPLGRPRSPQYGGVLHRSPPERGLGSTIACSVLVRWPR